MKNVTLIFPNQLFKNIEWIDRSSTIFLIEEYLFFRQYNFHKQKLIFHRSSMRFYFDYLLSQGLNVIYIESHQETADITTFFEEYENEKIDIVNIISCDDNYLEKRITNKTKEKSIKLKVHNNQSFLNTKSDLLPFFKNKKSKLFQTSFYIQQRKKWDILIKDKDKPVGEKWSFDSDRSLRKKDNQPPSFTTWRKLLYK